MFNVSTCCGITLASVLPLWRELVFFPPLLGLSSWQELRSGSQAGWRLRQHNSSQILVPGSQRCPLLGQFVLITREIFYFHQTTFVPQAHFKTRSTYGIFQSVIHRSPLLIHTNKYLCTHPHLVLEMSNRGEMRGNTLHQGSLSWNARLVIVQSQFLNIWRAPVCHLPVHSVCPNLWLSPHSVFYNDILVSYGTCINK